MSKKLIRTENGLLHNVNGPAIIYNNGDTAWYIQGQLHRTDGPAVEFVNGSKQYWIEGKQLTEQEFIDRHASCVSVVKTTKNIIIALEYIAAFKILGAAQITHEICGTWRNLKTKRDLVLTRFCKANIDNPSYVQTTDYILEPTTISWIKITAQIP